MKVVIIGGGSAGTAVAFELRKLNKDIAITVLEKTNNMAYSPCALPYLLAGDIKDIFGIFLYQKEDYAENNIDLVLNSEVVEIERKRKMVCYLIDGVKKQVDYDYLVLTTGSVVNQLSEDNCVSFKTIEDLKKIELEIEKIKKVVVVGGGMIGLELADAFSMRKKEVVLVEKENQLLSRLLDFDIAEKLKDSLSFDVYLDVNKFELTDKKISFLDKEISYDKLFTCVGMKLNVKLAKKIGIEVDKGIIVDQFLKTSDSNIYAGGDCVESVCFITGKKVVSLLGTIAVRHAKVIAENILGGNKKFNGVLNSTISKIGHKYVGGVGLNMRNAKECGLEAMTAVYQGSVRSSYYSDNEKIIVKLIFDLAGRILGGQVIGDNEVAGRLNLIALAIEKKMNLTDLADMEACYNPATASIFDPVVLAAQVGIKKINSKNRSA